MRAKQGILWLAALGLVVIAQPAAAQANSSSTKTIWEGVYTTAQAESGERLAAQNCVICHAPSTEWGHPSFIAAWNGRSIADLREHIQASMPFDRPGALTSQEYTDIVAYMLKLGNVPPGEQPLPTGKEAQEQIGVTRQAP
jgi:cytochrome c